MLFRISEMTGWRQDYLGDWVEATKRILDGEMGVISEGYKK